MVIERLFKITNKKIKEAPIDALYYDILAEIVTKYDHQLTALELSVNEYQKSHLSNQLQRCLIVLVLIK
jgi:magnesium transporter